MCVCAYTYSCVEHILSYREPLLAVHHMEAHALTPRLEQKSVYVWSIFYLQRVHVHIFTDFPICVCSSIQEESHFHILCSLCLGVIAYWVLFMNPVPSRGWGVPWMIPQGRQWISWLENSDSTASQRHREFQGVQLLNIWLKGEIPGNFLCHL